MCLPFVCGSKTTIWCRFDELRCGIQRWPTLCINEWFERVWPLYDQCEATTRQESARADKHYFRGQGERILFALARRVQILHTFYNLYQLCPDTRLSAVRFWQILLLVGSASVY